ncbi:hypothetical protein [Nocardia sp. NPDC127526]|uniref:hypothetical protein n=1 Tax=Nocardia sp. NPDC127526 TaxID=3345393 RepID=UPI00362EC479
MNFEQYRHSREAAAKAVSAVLAVLEKEPARIDVRHWHGRFAAMARFLADPDVDDKSAVDETLEFVSELYAAGRNITDFYLVRQDFDEQRAVNIDFENKLDAIKHAVGAGGVR